MVNIQCERFDKHIHISICRCLQSTEDFTALVSCRVRHLGVSLMTARARSLTTTAAVAPGLVLHHLPCHARRGRPAVAGVVRAIYLFCDILPLVFARASTTAVSSIGWVQGWRYTDGRLEVLPLKAMQGGGKHVLSWRTVGEN